MLGVRETDARAIFQERFVILEIGQVRIDVAMTPVKCHYVLGQGVERFEVNASVALPLIVQDYVNVDYTKF